MSRSFLQVIYVESTSFLIFYDSVRLLNYDFFLPENLDFVEQKLKILKK